VSLTLPIGSEKIKQRLFAVGLVGFLSALSIGVDGHPIFQILAVESLGLGPRAIGVALGLGTLSIPVQIWAARIPLHRARHNVRLFLWTMGAMALATAALVAFAEPGSWVAGLALAVAIAAEISVSVLMATAWQPLISYSLSPVQRAFMLGPAAALRGMLILGSTVLVGALDRTGRTAFLVVVGIAVLVVAETLRQIPAPPDADSVWESSANEDANDGEPVPPPQAELSAGVSPAFPPGILSLYLMTAALALGRWPLLVTYAAITLWPTGNLGLLGAALSAGGIAASLLWRDPGRHVLTAIRAGAVLAAVCTVGLTTIDGPITTSSGAALLLALAAVGSAARNVTGTASMELVHRRIDTTNSVRVMTMLDVIGSTTAQLNMFVAGFLIAATAAASPFELAGLDVFQIWIVVMAVVELAAAARLRLRPGDFAPSAPDLTHPATP